MPYGSTCPDNDIWRRIFSCIYILKKIFFSKSLYINTFRYQPLYSSNYFILPTISECENKYHFSHHTVSSIAWKSISRIDDGISHRSHTTSSLIQDLTSFGTSFGIFSSKSQNIELISSFDLSRIFSFESAHILTYLMPAFRQSVRTGSTLSPPFSCQKTLDE